MNEVRHLPVAEQYPSSTATVSAFASKRISGIAAHERNRPGNESAPVEAAISSEGEVFMSGCALLFFEHIRPQQLEIHEASLRNPGVPPFRNGRWFHVAQIRNGGRTAKLVNDCV